ncbi:TPA: hypothetical protein ACHU7U_001569 [Streptococcus suis]
MVDQWLRNASNHFGELESSYIRGRRRGKEEGRLDVAYQLLREGFSNEMIEKLTGLSSAQIEQLSKHHQV